MLLDGIQKNWTRALSDRKTWLWLLDGWDEWVESSGVCVHWKKKKNKSRRTIEEEDDGLQDKDAGMMVLPGDAGFVDVRSEAWMESGGEEGEARFWVLFLAGGLIMGWEGLIWV